eukprot:2220418-Amphidinium_carterae.1
MVLRLLHQTCIGQGPHDEPSATVVTCEDLFQQSNIQSLCSLHMQSQSNSTHTQLGKVGRLYMIRRSSHQLRQAGQ